MTSDVERFNSTEDEYQEDEERGSDRHVKSFLNTWKARAVQDGTCCQVIQMRGVDPVDVGDHILFHGWAGKPYKSEWSWRKRVRVTEVMDVFIRQDGIILQQWPPTLAPWNHPFVRRLAEDEGVVPPTGKELYKILDSTYGLKEPGAYQIIKWSNIDFGAK